MDSGAVYGAADSEPLIQESRIGIRVTQKKEAV
jgi:hypothetical protein